MDNALKQRILGIIVLFALIGICISVLLHNNKTEREKGIQRAHQLLAEQQQRQIAPTTPPTTQNQMTAVSQPTEVNQTPATPPTASVFNTTTPATASTSAAPTPTATPAPTKTSALNNFTPPVTPTHPATTKPSKAKATTTTATTQKTFIVQVGTFSNKSNTTALVKALHERGFNATAHSTKTSHGILTKVIVGGEKGLTKAEAETAKLRLKKTLDLNGIISPIATSSHHTTKKPTTTKKTTPHHETKSTTTSTTESAVSQKDSGAVVIP